MKYLTCSASDKRDNMINGTTVQGSSALAHLLQVIAAYEDGGEEETDGYWHP